MFAFGGLCWSEMTENHQKLCLITMLWIFTGINYLLKSSFLVYVTFCHAWLPVDLK